MLNNANAMIVYIKKACVKYRLNNMLIPSLPLRDPRHTTPISKFTILVIFFIIATTNIDHAQLIEITSFKYFE